MGAEGGGMSYDVVKEIDKRHVEPTLQELVRAAMSFGTDRVTLVRRPDATRGAGLVIVLLGRSALRELGPMLLSICPEESKEKTLVLHPNRPVYHGLTWLEENDLTWAYHDFGIAGQKGLAVWLVGARVTDELAEQLTARGCMTRLT